jgi:hypothetical protein
MRRSVPFVLFLLLAACGDSPVESAIGTYATFEMSPKMTEDEEAVFGGVADRLDELDRKTDESDPLKIRLDLEKGGTFSWRGPLGEGDSTEARISGTWTADKSAVTLRVAKSGGSDLPEAPKSVRLSRAGTSLRIVGFRDAATGKDVLLPKRR